MVGAEPPRRWQAPDELVAIGFDRARVVMMNEAHDGFRRSVRTREVGRQILPTAHAAGVRHLAMEALFPAFAEQANATRSLPQLDQGYLSQPEMRELIGDALDLGWTLIPYEAHMRAGSEQSDWRNMEATNWREEEQARNLTDRLRELPPEAELLVWCGNGHLLTEGMGGWRPMGAHFRELACVEVFALDQIRGVRFDSREPIAAPWVRRFAAELDARGGAAGFLADEAPSGWQPWGVEAFLLIDDEVV